MNEEPPGADQCQYLTLNALKAIRDTKMNNVDPTAWLTQALKRIANQWPKAFRD